MDIMPEYHAKCIAYNEKCIEYYKKCIEYHAKYIVYHEPCIEYHAECIVYLAECIAYHAECIEYQAAVGGAGVDRGLASTDWRRPGLRHPEPMNGEWTSTQHCALLKKQQQQSSSSRLGRGGCTGKMLCLTY